jgi:hypothetical protein
MLGDYGFGRGRLYRIDRYRKAADVAFGTVTVLVRPAVPNATRSDR